MFMILAGIMDSAGRIGTNNYKKRDRKVYHLLFQQPEPATRTVRTCKVIGTTASDKNNS